jgi:Na+-driven multidrug efflux pump
VTPSTTLANHATNNNAKPTFNPFLPYTRTPQATTKSLQHTKGHRKHHLLTSTASASSDEDADDQKEDIKSLKKKLTKEFFAIGAPAFMQLAAEPLAALVRSLCRLWPFLHLSNSLSPHKSHSFKHLQVDTAYLGRLGPEILGGAGVAISAQYSVSKIYNDPLLRTSISMVASQDGKTRGRASSQDDKDALSIQVSSALLLAFCVGVIQLVVFSVLANAITIGMGVTDISPMWHSATSYLRVRALGTPAATLWLVTNGIFRGLGNTRTPLIYSLCFTALNAILDPIFIFTFHFGASGAAAGTAIAQYIALVPLLLALNKQVPIDILGQMSKLGDALKSYLSAGSYVLVRTLGKVFAYSVCAREAVSCYICYRLIAVSYRTDIDLIGH